MLKIIGSRFGLYLVQHTYFSLPYEVWGVDDFGNLVKLDIQQTGLTII